MQKFSLDFKNYLELSKPRITFFCVIMAAVGIFLAPGKISALSFLMTLVATALSVACANTFNMIFERNIDQLMDRTKLRPLASQRMKIKNAIIFAILIGICAILLFGFYVNWLTAFLSFLSIIFYSMIYTPLKVKTPLALVIGAVPGAAPPLLGWTAVTDQITVGGLVLFGILFAWQMPHFLAISLFHKADYARAGIQVVPVVRGDQVAKIQAFLWTLVLIIMSLSICFLKLGGFFYIICAVLLGSWFLYLSVLGLKNKEYSNWPKRFFLASLVYLPALMLGLVIDRVIYLLI
jgi:protoheme IX farnesyltransferase